MGKSLAPILLFEIEVATRDVVDQNPIGGGAGPEKAVCIKARAVVFLVATWNLERTQNLAVSEEEHAAILRDHGDMPVSIRRAVVCIIDFPKGVCLFETAVQRQNLHA